jgi:hypothetical protein
MSYTLISVVIHTSLVRTWCKVPPFPPLSFLLLVKSFSSKQTFSFFFNFVTLVPQLENELNFLKIYNRLRKTCRLWKLFLELLWHLLFQFLYPNGTWGTNPFFQFLYQSVSVLYHNECRCNTRLKVQTEGFTRLVCTGCHGGLEHLKIEKMLRDERFQVRFFLFIVKRDKSTSTENSYVYVSV